MIVFEWLSGAWLWLVALAVTGGVAIAGWWTAGRRRREVQTERKGRIIASVEADRAKHEIEAAQTKKRAAEDQAEALRALNEEARRGDDSDDLAGALDRAVRDDRDPKP